MTGTTERLEILEAVGLAAVSEIHAMMNVPGNSAATIGFAQGLLEQIALARAQPAGRAIDRVPDAADLAFAGLPMLVASSTIGRQIRTAWL